MEYNFTGSDSKTDSTLWLQAHTEKEMEGVEEKDRETQTQTDEAASNVLIFSILLDFLAASHIKLGYYVHNGYIPLKSSHTDWFSLIQHMLTLFKLQFLWNRPNICFKLIRETDIRSLFKLCPMLNK